METNKHKAITLIAGGGIAAFALLAGTSAVLAETQNQLPCDTSLTVVIKDQNAGINNMGFRNNGNGNRGDENAGDNNVGCRNNGNNNVGNNNEGNNNTGSFNVGNGNVGDNNEGNNNVGSFNTGNGIHGSFQNGDASASASTNARDSRNVDDRLRMPRI